MLVLNKLIYRFNAIPIKIPSYFMYVDNLIVKFTWRGKRPRIANNVEEQSWRTDAA